MPFVSQPYHKNNSSSSSSSSSCINGLKLYRSSNNDIDRLEKSVKIASEDIGMRFGMDKCTALRMKREKHGQCEGTVLGEGMMMGEAN